MLEDDETTESTPDEAAESPEQRRARPRRSASRAAGPPPVAANPFMPAAPAAEPAQPVAAVPPAAPTPPAAAATPPSAVVAVFQVPQLPVPIVEAEAEETRAPSPDEAPEPGRKRGGRNRRAKGGGGASGGQAAPAGLSEEPAEVGDAQPEAEDSATAAETGTEAPASDSDAEGDDENEGSSSTRRRRRRRRGSASESEADADDPNTVTKIRAPKESEPADRVTGVKGSTRLEAKKQRRREGREAGRRRAPILSEAEFLARREAVDRTMVVRQLEEVTQIAVLEDGVLVEHYVAKDVAATATMAGNVYLGRVQNVLPSMEAAFIDIGRGRNAVLYAGEVNWDAAGLEGQPKRIEFALKSGDPVLVQVTKDPIGHKGARLTSQVSLPGRYLVFVPDGSMTGISRKLPDTERSRLRGILKRIVPDDVGIIVRTAAEGASEEELTRDVARLTNTWQEIKRRAKSASPPHLLHAEPDLAIRVVRDIFNEDFKSAQVAGDTVWNQIKAYVDSVAPDLADRVSKWTGTGDVFSHHRIDEQLAKALDRKVWLPSGGSLIIEHTEAMAVIDVNTGKFTGQGGDLEETVTQNNLEAAEEIVRQVRLRDIGGIIVIDFIDMVLESNRDLVLRRLVECLGRDRTKHQVTEITSLGLAQMTRKRIGAGLLETFSEPCDACNGRGVKIHLDSHGVPLSGRRKPVKPTGAHDPVEMMMRSGANAPAAESEAATTAAPSEDEDVELPERYDVDDEFVDADTGEAAGEDDDNDDLDADEAGSETPLVPATLVVEAVQGESAEDAAPAESGPTDEQSEAGPIVQAEHETTSAEPAGTEAPGTEPADSTEDQRRAEAQVLVPVAETAAAPAGTHLGGAFEHPQPGAADHDGPQPL